MANAPHADTKEKEPDKKPAPTTTGTPAPKDTAALAQEMLMLLTADWLNNDRTHQARNRRAARRRHRDLAPPVNGDVPYVSQIRRHAQLHDGQLGGRADRLRLRMAQ